MIKPPRTFMLAAPSAAAAGLSIYGMLPESVSLNPVSVGPEIWNAAVVPMPGQPARFEFVRQGSPGGPMRMTLRQDATSAPFLANLAALVTTEGDTRFVCTSGAALVMFNNGDGEDVFEAPFSYGMQVERQIRANASLSMEAQREAMDRIIGGDPYYPQYYGSIAPKFELLIPSAPGGYIFEVVVGSATSRGKIDFATYDAGGVRNALVPMDVPGGRLRRIRFDRVIGAGGAMAIGNQGEGVLNVFVNPVERAPNINSPFGSTRIGQTRISDRMVPQVDDGGWTPIRYAVTVGAGSRLVVSNAQAIQRIEYTRMSPEPFRAAWGSGRLIALFDQRGFAENFDGFGPTADLDVIEGTGVVELYANRTFARPIIEGVNAILQVIDGERKGPVTPLRAPGRAAAMSASDVNFPPITGKVDGVLDYTYEPVLDSVPWPARVLKPRDAAPAAAAPSSADGMDEERFQRLAIPPGPCDTCGGKDATFGGGRECWACWRARMRRENDAAMAPNRAPAVITARKSDPPRSEARERRRAARALRIVRRERQTISRSQEYGASEFYPPDGEDYEPAELVKRGTVTTQTFTLGPNADAIVKDIAAAMATMQEELLSRVSVPTPLGPASPAIGGGPAFRKAFERFVDGPRAPIVGVAVSSTSDGGNQAGGVVKQPMTDPGPMRLRINGQDVLGSLAPSTFTWGGGGGAAGGAPPEASVRPDDRPRLIVGSIPEVEQRDIDNLRATTMSVVNDFADLLEDPADPEGVSTETGQYAWALLSGCALGGIWDRDMTEAVGRMARATAKFNRIPEPSCALCSMPPLARCSRHALSGFDAAEIITTARQPRRDAAYLSALQAFALGAIVDFAEMLGGMAEDDSDEGFNVRDLGRRAWNEIRRWGAFNGQPPSNYPIGYRRFLVKLSQLYNDRPNRKCRECGGRMARCNRCRVQVPADIYDPTSPAESGL